MGYTRNIYVYTKLYKNVCVYVYIHEFLQETYSTLGFFKRSSSIYGRMAVSMKTKVALGWRIVSCAVSAGLSVSGGAGLKRIWGHI